MATDSEKLKKELVHVYNSAVDTYEGNLPIYNKLATDYERVFLGNGCTLHLKLADLCLKHLPSETKSMKLLDVATGTGLAAQALKDKGFEGTIDGLDGCQEMVDRGNRKHIYRNIVVQLITPDNPYPFPDNVYDVVMCSGALCIGHIPHETIRDMLRVLVPGGRLVFNSCYTKPNDINNVAIGSVSEAMKKLVEEKKCVLLEEVCDIKNFEAGDEEIIGCTNLYCYKKI